MLLLQQRELPGFPLSSQGEVITLAAMDMNLANVATISLQLVDGVTVVAPNDIAQITPYVLMEQRDWFEDEIRFVREFIQPGARALDVGANFGVYALSMAAAAGPDGRVWAIEPSARTAGLLQQSAAANGFEHVQVLQCALSDSDGQAFLQHGGSPELHSLAPDARGPGQRGGEAVATFTLDTLAATRQIRNVQFVKVDAEGQETRILAGAAKFLQNESPLWMLELKHGPDVDRPLLDAVAALGLQMFRLVPGLNILTPLDLSAPVEPYLLNFFACNADRANQLSAAGFAALTTPTETAALPAGSSVPRAPFSARLNWQGAQHRPASDLHLQAIGCFYRSHDKRYSAMERVGLLARAATLLGTTCQQAPTAARLSTLARVCWEWGERARAVKHLATLAETLTAGGELGMDEPFLPACARFDAIAADEHPAEWLLAATLEQYERLAGFSSFFTGGNSLQQLQWLAASRFASGEMRTRYELVQRRLQPPGGAGNRR